MKNAYTLKVLEQNYQQLHRVMNTDQSGAVRKKIENYSYLMNQSIGKGYSSIVYKGRNDLTNETVAIKVIDMKMIKGQVHKNLLASQIEVLKSVKNCENIIQVYDIFSTRNNTYIITELCEGGDLSKLISSAKPLSQAEAIPLINQIIKGYCSLHNHGIIHRDLKPANIFLKNNMVKIADFGFAMKQTDLKKYSSYNVGSPVYMPPQALNQNKYSFKSDIWALGVIYYEMLTGKTPWRAKTQKQLGKQLNAMPIKRLIPPSISHSSESFLLRTLAINVNQRMSPQELQKCVLSQDSIKINTDPYFTQHSIFDGRNNNIRGTDQGIRVTNRHDTSLAKNTVNNPSNNQRRPTFFQSTDQFNIKRQSLPKTAASISNQPENFMSINSNQTINNIQIHTQKQIYQQTRNQTLTYDKKNLSKQLLSQIHFCRFLYKLIVRMNEKLSKQINEECKMLKEYMTGLIFEKLEEVYNLRAVDSRFVYDYKCSEDFHKISQIINQYQVKYRRDLLNYRQMSMPLVNIKDQITKNIISLYQKVEDSENINEYQEEVIVLDYLVTLRQLIGLLLSNDIDGFHNKSKIEIIVQGAPSKNITHEHLNAIRSKLRAIRII